MKTVIEQRILLSVSAPPVPVAKAVIAGPNFGQIPVGTPVNPNGAPLPEVPILAQLAPQQPINADMKTKEDGSHDPYAAQPENADNQPQNRPANVMNLLLQNS